MGEVLLPPDLLARWKLGLRQIEQAVFRHKEGLFNIELDTQLLSGEPCTSLFGTAYNIFVTWLAKGEPVGFFEEGGDVENLRVSGDDKIDDVPIEQTRAVCEQLGLEVTLEGQGTILELPFLGRYHFLKRGRLHSCAQFVRTLSKFHLSPNKMLERQELLHSKACCYLCTDYHTPVIGAMCYFLVCRFGSKAPVYDSYRQALADLSVDDYLAMGPPSFCEDAAAVICYHEGLNIGVLRFLHNQALAGMFPDALPVGYQTQLDHYYCV